MAQEALESVRLDDRCQCGEQRGNLLVGVHSWQAERVIHKVAEGINVTVEADHPSQAFLLQRLYLLYFHVSLFLREAVQIAVHYLSKLC